MAFTDDQKEIIKYIGLEKITDLQSFVRQYLPTKNISVEEFTHNYDLKGDEIINHFKDFFQVWVFLEKNNLMKTTVAASYKLLHFYIKEKKDKEVYESQLLVRSSFPYHNLNIHLSLDLNDFINNDYKTTEQLRFERENISRKDAQKWTRITAIASIIFGLASAIIALIATSNRNVTILNPTKFPDTVKVMYYNPPKDTGIFIHK